MDVTSKSESVEAKALSRAVGRVVAAGLAVYVALLGFNSLTRIRSFSPDSMSYTGMAENLVKGHGLSHCLHGVRVLSTREDARSPQPVSKWPPLFPLLAGAVHATGVPAPDAVLVVAVLFAGVTLLGIYLLGRELFGAPVGLLAVTALLVYEPFHLVSSTAWSETTGIAFVVFGLYALVLRRDGGGRWRRYGLPLAAGLLGGLAFAARYASAPFFLVGVLALVERKGLKKNLEMLALFAAGFLLIAAPVLLRNFDITGSPLGYARAQSTQGLLVNLSDFYVVLAWRSFPKLYLWPLLQALLFWASAIVLAVQLARPKARRAILAALKRTVFGGKRYVPALWCAGYLSFLIVYRSITHFDRINSRLASPGTVVLVLLLVAFLVHLAAPRARTLAMVALGLLALGLTREAVVAKGEATSHVAQRSALSERLKWVGENTTARDLVVGYDLGAIPFYFGQRPVIIRYDIHFPEGHIGYESLVAYAERYCGDYDRIFLVTEAKGHQKSEEQWRIKAGGFITDLVFGRVDGYPGLERLDVLEHGSVFRIRCGAGS